MSIKAFLYICIAAFLFVLMNRSLNKSYAKLRKKQASELKEIRGFKVLDFEELDLRVRRSFDPQYKFVLEDYAGNVVPKEIRVDTLVENTRTENYVFEIIGDKIQLTKPYGRKVGKVVVKERTLNE